MKVISLINPRRVSKYKELEFNVAELRAMFTTPLELLPAPGAGISYVVDDVNFFLDVDAIQFAGAASDIFLQYSTEGVVYRATDWFTNALGLKMMANVGLGAVPSFNNNAFEANKPLNLTSNNDWTGGGENARLIVRIWYAEVIA
jgi:hypothetical protein